MPPCLMLAPLRSTGMMRMARPRPSLRRARGYATLLLLGAGWALGVPAAAALRPGDAFRDCARICPEMVVVPPGSYLMGSPPEDPHQGKASTEQPQHRVDISYAFAVGRFEVTRDEYAAFVRDTGLADPDGCNVHEPPRWPTIMGLNWHNTGFSQSGRDPVVCVSWLEAEAYTRWLSQKTGHRYRLLSEAEWEYADRAGTQSQAYWGDDPNEACKYANGVDATRLLAPLGVRLPVVAAKGYSRTYPRDPSGPQRPVYLEKPKVSVSVFDGGARVSGTLELGARDLSLSQRRLTAITAAAQRAMPGWRMSAEPFDWAGMRSLSDDGLPFIGAIPGHDGVYVATGHSTLGITLAPLGGELLAELVLERNHSPLLQAFDPARSASRRRPLQPTQEDVK